jgi:decaprenyl-phosphate phosphoribosyltransferase
VTSAISAAGALLEACRPRQWIKNVLVAAAPLAAGTLQHAHVLARTAIALAVFVLLSASTYLINDAWDVNADREHPIKRRRPLARGAVSVPAAVTTAVVLMGGAIVLAGAAANSKLLLCAGSYALLTQLYTFWLKDEPVLDLAAVACGFLLRAIAGGLAADIPLSRWFLTVAGFGSLFLVAGKRYSELVMLGDDAHLVRKTHASYSATYLRFVWSSAAAVLLTTYCLWAFEVATRSSASTSAPWAAISVGPFVVGVLRYARDVDQGQAGEPEEIFLRDRGLQLIGLIWIVIFALGAINA